MRSPFTGGNVIKKSRLETYTFRNEEFTVQAYYFECVDTGRTFTNAEVDDQLMKDVYSQYRKRHGIPSPSELKNLREKYGLSAHGEMPTVIVGQKLSTLFERESLLKSIDGARIKLGKDFERVKQKVESYVEPKSFNLAKVYYPQFNEIVPLMYPSIAYRIRKPRWATCQ